MGKGSNQISQDVQQGMLSNESALVQLAQQQGQRATQLFNLTEPGLASAEQYYGSIASGSPYAISTATAPAMAQVAAATQGAKQNILTNAPAGGEKNLAIENADVAQGAQIGDLTSGAYTRAFSALAQLANQGGTQSYEQSYGAASDLNAASQALSQLGNINDQQKSSMLGAGESAAEIGGTIAIMV